jgi:hypothetical protein
MGCVRRKLSDAGLVIPAMLEELLGFTFDADVFAATPGSPTAGSLHTAHSSPSPPTAASP